MKLMLRVLLLTAILGTSVLALMPTPPSLIGAGTDPTKHAIGMLAVTALAGLAFPQTSLLAVIGVVAIGSGLLEFAQGMPSLTRDPDLDDWIAGMIGAIAAALVVCFWRLVISLRKDRTSTVSGERQPDLLARYSRNSESAVPPL